jgi:hypothetical protein
MGLWSVSMLVAAELLRVLRVPSTVVALAQGLVQVTFLRSDRTFTLAPVRRANFLPTFGCSRESAPKQSRHHDLSVAEFSGGHSQRQRNVESERLGGCAVNEEFELGRLMDRQVGRLGALGDIAGADANLTIHFRNVGVVAHSCSLGSSAME